MRRRVLGRSGSGEGVQAADWEAVEDGFYCELVEVGADYGVCVEDYRELIVLMLVFLRGFDDSIRFLSLREIALSFPREIALDIGWLTVLCS